MKFLVEIHAKLPPDLPEPERDRLMAAERERGRELVEAGVLRGIWRIPGALRNVGVWEAVDATELHEHLAGLPVYPWMTVEVTPLAVHPLQQYLPEDQV